MAKFNRLDVPYQWKDEFTKYPHGYTIFEALCKWVKQVDNMVDNINNWNDYLDNFVENFEFELQEEVQSTITRWQDEGLLDDIIESVLTTELDSVKSQLADIVINVKSFGAKGDGVTDDTVAIQNALNVGGNIFFPNGVYIVKEQLLINSNTSIIGDANAYIVIDASYDNSPHIYINEKKNIDISLNIKTSPLKPQGAILEAIKCDNIAIHDCIIDGGAEFNDVTGEYIADKGAAGGLRLDSCVNANVFNCTIKNFRNTQGLSFNACINFKAERNTITNTNRAGISINAGSKNGRIVENTLMYNVRNFEYDGAIDMYGFTPECENIIIEKNTISHTGKNGWGDTGNCCIRLNDGFCIKVLNNVITVDNEIFSAISIGARTVGSKITDIQIEGNTITYNADGMSVLRTVKTNPPIMSNVKIINNTFQGTGKPKSFEIRGYIEGLVFKGNQVFLPEMTFEFLFFNKSYIGEKARKNISISDNQITVKGMCVRAAASVDTLIISNNIFKSNGNVNIVEVQNDCNNVIFTNNQLFGINARYNIEESVIDKVVDNNILKEI